MSIQPLDFQVNIAQQTEVGRSQQAAQQAPIDSKHHADEKATQEAKTQQTKVQAANQPESEKVEAEGRGSTGYTPGKRKKEENKEEEEVKDLPKDPTKGKFIDVVK
ncbi:MAG: hypothetical protein QMD92_05120 [bacterium]|nr:hypothetical protein [bacterium]